MLLWIILILEKRWVMLSIVYIKGISEIFLEIVSLIILMPLQYYLFCKISYINLMRRLQVKLRFRLRLFLYNIKYPGDLI